MSEQNPTRRWRIPLPLVAVLVPIVYVLSSGPVLAIAFLLRSATRWDGFYAAMWLYYPLLRFGGPNNPFANYIWWWCNLLDAMPPG